MAADLCTISASQLETAELSARTVVRPLLPPPASGYKEALRAPGSVYVGQNNEVLSVQGVAVPQAIVRSGTTLFGQSQLFGAHVVVGDLWVFVVHDVKPGDTMLLCEHVFPLYKHHLWYSSDYFFGVDFDGIARFTPAPTSVPGTDITSSASASDLSYLWGAFRKICGDVPDTVVSSFDMLAQNRPPNFMPRTSREPKRHPNSLASSRDEAARMPGDVREERGTGHMYRKLGMAYTVANVVKNSDFREAPTSLGVPDGVVDAEEIVVTAVEHAERGAIMTLYEHLYPRPHRYFWMPEALFEGRDGAGNKYMQTVWWT